MLSILKGAPWSQRWTHKKGQRWNIKRGYNKKSGFERKGRNDQLVETLESLLLPLYTVFSSQLPISILSLKPIFVDSSSVFLSCRFTSVDILVTEECPLPSRRESWRSRRFRVSARCSSWRGCRWWPVRRSRSPSWRPSGSPRRRWRRRDLPGTPRACTVERVKEILLKERG